MVKGIEGEKERYLDLVINGDFDLIMNYGAQVWTTDLVLPVLDRSRAKKVLVPCGFSYLKNNNYADYYKKMASWMGRYDACVFMSERYRDMEFARRSGIKNTVVIPNGAAEDEFGLSPRLDIRARLGSPRTCS